MGTLNVITSATETVEGKGCAVKLESGIWQPGSALWEKDANNEWIQRWGGGGKWEEVLAFPKPGWSIANQSPFSNQYQPGNDLWFETDLPGKLASINVETGAITERVGYPALSGLCGSGNKHYFYELSSGGRHWVDGQITNITGIPNNLSTNMVFDGANETGDVYYLITSSKQGVYRVVGNTGVKIATQSKDQRGSYNLLISPDGEIMYWLAMKNANATQEAYCYNHGSFSQNYGNLMEITGVMDEVQSIPAKIWGKVSNADEVSCVREYYRNEKRYYQYLHKNPGTDQFTCVALPHPTNKFTFLRNFFELDNGKCVWIGIDPEGGNHDAAFISDGPEGELKPVEGSMPAPWVFVVMTRTGPNRVSAIMADTQISKNQKEFKLLNLEL